MNHLSRAGAYDELANIWDKHWGMDSKLRFGPIIESLFLPQLKENMKLLDLCCGSGQLSQFFIDAGLKVTGVDFSEKMLERARANAPKADFIQADIRYLNLSSQHDACTMLGESINQLTDLSSVEIVFENIADSLTEGGVFLFDLMTELKDNSANTATVSGDGQLCHSRSELREDLQVKASEFTLIAEENGQFSQKNFSIYFRPLEVVQIKRLLKEAGFRAVASFDAEADFGLKGERGREILLARK